MRRVWYSESSFGTLFTTPKLYICLNSFTKAVVLSFSIMHEKSFKRPFTPQTRTLQKKFLIPSLYHKNRFCLCRRIFVLIIVSIFCSSDGIVLCELWMVFTTDAISPIRPLNLAVKRGRLRYLAIEMDGYDVTQVVGMFEF